MPRSPPRMAQESPEAREGGRVRDSLEAHWRAWLASGKARQELRRRGLRGFQWSKPVGVLESQELTYKEWRKLRRYYAVGDNGLRYIYGHVMYGHILPHLHVGEKMHDKEQRPPLPPVGRDRDRALPPSTLPPRNQFDVVEGGEVADQLPLDSELPLPPPPLQKELLAIGYCRSSTDDQRLSYEYQRYVIGEWCKKNKVRLVGVCRDEGVSGTADMFERAGLSEAIARVRHHKAQYLVVAKRDRLARNVYVAAAIETAIKKIKCRVISADGSGNGDTPADMFVAAMMNAAAAFERDLISDRTKSALAALKRSGRRWSGSIRYGYRLLEGGKHVEKDEKEQAVIAKVRMYAAEGLGPRRISRKLWEEGIVSRKGTRFADSQIYRMLESDDNAPE